MSGRNDELVERLRRLILDVPDFPRAGIVFKDITPVLADPPSFAAACDWLAARLEEARVEQVLAIESRGFIFGTAAAARLGLPLYLVRKPGKLPRATLGADYALEYGHDRLEIHQDAIRPGTRYGIVDDLIATGGTAAAVAGLLEEHGGRLTCCAFLVELGFLSGRDRLPDGATHSLLRYD
ncbi:MAG: adenine phosphoribosyltransferase [Chromatiales bacterium]|nr:adenine phosphoribosyltransferase [Chromatiales bacterium]